MGFAVVIAVFITSALSGILGMGGGFILAGVLALMLPLSSALMLHALVQFGANGYRSYLNRHAIHWRIVQNYIGGMLFTAALFFTWRVTVDKAWFYILLGSVALSSQFVPKQLALDASRPWHGRLAGALVSALHLFVGVAGPLLDVFFQRTQLNRFQIVATKSATQTLGHLMRIVFYFSVFQAHWQSANIHTYALIAAAVATFAGTYIGTQILKKVNEQQFAVFTRWLLNSLGVFFIVRGVLSF